MCVCFLLTQAFWWHGYYASRYVDDDPPAVRPGSAGLEGKIGREASKVSMCIKLCVYMCVCVCVCVCVWDVYYNMIILL